MPDAIHQTLADIQASLTTTCHAESPDGTVRAEASAKRQLALHLSPAALRMHPADLAALILATQHEAQTNAENQVAATLDTFREDPRVTSALTTLRDTQPDPTPTRPRRDDPDDDVIAEVYDKNTTW